MIILQVSQNGLYINKGLSDSHERENSKKLEERELHLTICFSKKM